MKINLKQKGYTTIVVEKDTRNKLIAIKIRTEARSLNDVIRELIKNGN